MPRALLFDLDNTLVDRDAAWRAVLDARAPGLDPERRARALAADERGRRPRDAYVAWLQDHLPNILPPGPGPWAQLAREIAARTRAFPEVFDALDTLQPRFRTAIVSDGAVAVQRAKLRASGLAARFEVVVISEQVGAKKPDPKPFFTALEALGVPAEAAWFIGDHPRADIAGAAALGMTTVWRRYGDWAPEVPRAEHEVDDLSGLVEHLR